MLLDIDGTLLLSNDAHARAYADAAAELRLEPNIEHIRRLIGKGGDKLIPEAFGIDSESPLGKQLGELNSGSVAVFFRIACYWNGQHVIAIGGRSGNNYVCIELNIRAFKEEVLRHARLMLCCISRTFV